MFGIGVDALSMDETLDLLDSAIQTREQVLVGVVNAAKLVKMQRDPGLMQSVQEADVCLADGMSVVVASRVLGQGLPERVAGIDLMTRLLERGDELGYRFFFLGAREEVNATVVARVKTDHPGAIIAGRHHGYFDEDGEAAVAEAIRDGRVDVLFVAMSSPKKEQFMARWHTHLGATVVHGVGGSFDVYAGLVSRAPSSMQKLGMEWLWRLGQEPGRMWRRYLTTNATFAYMVLRELVTRWDRNPAGDVSS